jgi:hypothetical protein
LTALGRCRACHRARRTRRRIDVVHIVVRMPAGRSHCATVKTRGFRSGERIPLRVLQGTRAIAGICGSRHRYTVARGSVRLLIATLEGLCGHLALLKCFRRGGQSGGVAAASSQRSSAVAGCCSRRGRGYRRAGCWKPAGWWLDRSHEFWLATPPYLALYSLTTGRQPSYLAGVHSLADN